MSNIKESTARRIARMFLEDNYSNGTKFELIVYPRHGNIKTNEGEVIAFRCIPTLFIGNGNIVVSTDKQEAIDIMKLVEPNEDWNMFEIENYKEKYTVVYD